MDKRNVVHLFGASGSGTSTIGRALCGQTGFFFMDTDDYFWLPTDPPFQQKREAAERVRRMQDALDSHENAVISGSLVGWGDVFIPQFTLAIRVVTDTATRLTRIAIRERARFGSRIEPGGDMYAQHREFLAWSSRYDTGDPTQRSRAMHDIWEKTLSCPILTLDGGADLQENLLRITQLLQIDPCKKG